MPHVAVVSYALGFIIYIYIYPGKAGVCFFYYRVVFWCAQMNPMSTWWLACCIRLFAHFTTSLLSLCRRTRMYWTYQMLVRYTLSSVRLRLIQFSKLSIICNIWDCVYSANPFFIGRTVLLLKPPQSPHCYLGAVDHGIFPPPLVTLQARSYRAHRATQTLLF